MDALLFCGEAAYADQTRSLHWADRAGFHNEYWGPWASSERIAQRTRTAKVRVVDAGGALVDRFTAETDAQFFIAESKEHEPDRVLSLRD